MRYYQSINGTIYNGDSLRIIRTLRRHNPVVDMVLCRIPDGFNLFGMWKVLRQLRSYQVMNFVFIAGEEQHEYLLASRTKLRRYTMGSIVPADGKGDPLFISVFCSQQITVPYNSMGTMFPFDEEQSRKLHLLIHGDHTNPRQPLVNIYSYLIEKYSHPGHVVLDFTASNGLTPLACNHTGRDWICISGDEDRCRAIEKAHLLSKSEKVC